MRLTRVNSRAIDAVGYQAADRVLIVRFRSGETYEYDNVDRDLFEALLSSAHPWTEFGEEVKRHRFRHVSRTAMVTDFSTRRPLRS